MPVKHRAALVFHQHTLESGDRRPQRVTIQFETGGAGGGGGGLRTSLVGRGTFAEHLRQATLVQAVSSDGDHRSVEAITMLDEPSRWRYSPPKDC